MTKNADQVVVAANGSIYVGELGATAPATIDAAIDPAEWIDLGYANDDGVTFSDGKDTEDINAWQSFYALRRIVTAKEGSLQFNLLQWNGATVRLAFGGGTVTEDAAGEYRYEPPDPGVIDERAAIIEWVDGDRNYRLIVPRSMVSETVETNLTKSDAGELPITLSVLGQEGVKPWYLLTDDPAFAPTSSS